MAHYSSRVYLRLIWDNFKLMPPMLILALTVGGYLEREDDLRNTKFRDKSALYGGTVKPGDPPSWP